MTTSLCWFTNIFYLELYLDETKYRETWKLTEKDYLYYCMKKTSLELDTFYPCIYIESTMMTTSLCWSTNISSQALFRRAKKNEKHGNWERKIISFLARRIVTTWNLIHSTRVYITKIYAFMHTTVQLQEVFWPDLMWMLLQVIVSGYIVYLFYWGILEICICYATAFTVFLFKFFAVCSVRYKLFLSRSICP
jgi:hypothetical protein